MDRIKQQLDQLAELSDETIAQLQSEIVAEFETVEKEDPTPQTVDAMTSLADMLDTVRGEVKRREAQAEELANRAAEASARVKGAEAAEEMPEAESVPEDKEAEEPTEKDAPMAPDTKEEEEAPMAEASATANEGSEFTTSDELITEIKEVTTTEEAAPAEFSAEEAAEKPAVEAVAEEAAAITADGEEAAKEEVAPAVVEEAAAVEAPAEAPVAEAVAADAAIEAPAAEASTEIQETTAQTEQKEQEAPVTAAASPEEAFEAPADRRPVAQEAAAAVAITAGADIPGYTAGSQVKDMKEVAELMAKRLHGLRRVNGGDGEQHIVASVSTSYPSERTLGTDPEENWAKVQKVVGPEALVASGGHQAPFTTKYDIFGLGTTARPVRDALPKFQADRGGIRFITPPALSSYGNAVGVWTASNDSAETPDPASKLSLTVAAASETTVATDAVTLQMQFGNLMSRAYPELIARHNELGLIQHAREAEGQILSRLTTLSTAVTSTSLIGMGRDYLVQLGRAAANYRGRHRLEADAPLRVIAPAWVKDAMAADLALAAPGDNTMNAYAEIEGYIASRGINMTWNIDDFTTAQSSGAMNEFGDTFVWYIFAEGTFLFLDGGTLDLGVIRDSTLVGTNDYKMFVETFEGVAKVGLESLKVTSTINVNGAAAALRDTLGGVAAAVIEY